MEIVAWSVERAASVNSFSFFVRELTRTKEQHKSRVQSHSLLHSDEHMQTQASTHAQGSDIGSGETDRHRPNAESI